MKLKSTSRSENSFGCYGEPTLLEILSDPIVKGVMEADNVDPDTLETRLRSAAQPAELALLESNHQD